MIKNIEDLQKLGQVNAEGYMKGFGEWNKSWQTLAAEMTDYSKRSFEDGTAAFEKLLTAKSLEQAVEIQTGYVKRAYDEYMAQMTKIGTLYTDIAKDAYKPFEKVMGGARF
jgi:hypothetical protein